MEVNLLREFLKQERQKRGMSLRNFADMIGISHSYLSRLESGVDARSGNKVSPTLDIMIQIANALDISIIDLLRAIERGKRGEEVKE